jgi:hypothetical protein
MAGEPRGQRGLLLWGTLWLALFPLLVVTAIVLGGGNFGLTGFGLMVGICLWVGPILFALWVRRSYRK